MLGEVKRAQAILAGDDMEGEGRSASIWEEVVV